MSLWKSYVDDTISYLKEEFIEHILSKLNGYHDNIKFTYEIEKDDNQSLASGLRRFSAGIKKN